MSRWSWVLLALAACSSDPPITPPKSPLLRLARTSDGAVKIELLDGTVAVRAMEIELVASGGAAVILEDATPGPGVPLDTVRVKMAGTNRAVLFAGDTRGVRVGSSGELARVRARAAAGGPADGTLVIERAVLADGEGAVIAVELGGAVPLR